jgi:hypothetical protein
VDQIVCLHIGVVLDACGMDAQPHPLPAHRGGRSQLPRRERLHRSGTRAHFGARTPQQTRRGDPHAVVVARGSPWCWRTRVQGAGAPELDADAAGSDPSAATSAPPTSPVPGCAAIRHPAAARTSSRRPSRRRWRSRLISHRCVVAMVGRAIRNAAPGRLSGTGSPMRPSPMRGTRRRSLTDEVSARRNRMGPEALHLKHK